MLNLRQTIEKLQKVEAKQNELNALLDNKQEEIVALSKKNVELHSSLKNYEATANDTDKLQKIVSQKNAEIESVRTELEDVRKLLSTNRKSALKLPRKMLPTRCKWEIYPVN